MEPEKTLFTQLENIKQAEEAKNCSGEILEWFRLFSHYIEQAFSEGKKEKKDKKTPEERIAALCTLLAGKDDLFAGLPLLFEQYGENPLQTINSLLRQGGNILLALFASRFDALTDHGAIENAVSASYGSFLSGSRLFFETLPDIIKKQQTPPDSAGGPETVFFLVNELFSQHYTHVAPPEPAGLNVNELYSFYINQALRAASEMKQRLIVPFLSEIMQMTASRYNLNPDRHKPWILFGDLVEKPAGPEDDLQNGGLSVSLTELKELLTGYARKAMNEGILSLEDAIDTLAGDLSPEHILVKSVMFIVDGTDPVVVRSILENRSRADLNLRKAEGRIMIEGILSIQGGDNPRILCERLLALGSGYVDPCICTDPDYAARQEKETSLFPRSGPFLPGLIETLIGYSEKARREGLLALEDELEQNIPPLLFTGLALILCGTAPGPVETILTLLDSFRIDYFSCYDRLCIEGVLLIQEGKAPEVLHTLLSALIPGPSFPCKKEPSQGGYAGARDIITPLLSESADTDRGQEVLQNVLALCEKAAHILAPAAALDVLGLMAEKIIPGGPGRTGQAEDSGSAGFQELPGELFSQNPADLTGQNEIRQAAFFKKAADYNSRIKENIKKSLETCKERQKLQENLENGLHEQFLQVREKVTALAARNNPSLKNVGHLAPAGKIAAYLGELGTIYYNNRTKLQQMQEDLQKDNLNRLEELTKLYFHFSPEIKRKKNPDVLLEIIIDLFFEVSSLFDRVGEIITHPGLLSLFLKKTVSLENVFFWPDQAVAGIISRCDSKTLALVLKDVPEHFYALFERNMSGPVKKQLKKEQKDLLDSLPGQVEQARIKFCLEALKEPGIVTELKIQRSLAGQSLPDFY